MTGRSANQTGVYHLAQRQQMALVALQTHERTLAEALHDAGYFTALVGKWHLGDQDYLGLTPEMQGFDVFIDGRQSLRFDDPINVGDELISMMVSGAVETVKNRPDPSAPYALFFWSNDPHSRHDRSGREPLGWWKVDESLLPSNENYYHDDPAHDTERDRYRAVVEALDTELGRLLVELGVLAPDGTYQDDSETVVLMLGDNGTPPVITGGHGKGSLYEPGIRVPLLAFGERVPSDGAILDSPIGASDLYETICDIASVPDTLRGAAPRQSVSFAHHIGWGKGDLSRRFTWSSRGPSRQSGYQWVALADQRYKLVAVAADSQFTPLETDSFFDLAEDPGESSNLIENGMTAEQRAAYFEMRDVIVDEWCSAVAEPTPHQVDVPITHIASLTTTEQWFSAPNGLPIGSRQTEQRVLGQARLLARFDIEAIPDLLPPDRTIDDIEHAQIVLIFKSDARTRNEVDIGPIRAAPVTINWWDDRPTWNELSMSIVDAEVGVADLAPHLLPGDYGGSGPFVDGTRVSLGRHPTLLATIHEWLVDPARNSGVVLITDSLPDVVGDQYVYFHPEAFLRLSLRSD